MRDRADILDGSLKLWQWAEIDSLTNSGYKIFLRKSSILLSKASYVVFWSRYIAHTGSFVSG